MVHVKSIEIMDNENSHFINLIFLNVNLLLYSEDNAMVMVGIKNLYGCPFN